MTKEEVKSYLDVENAKLTKILSIGDKGLYAASCPNCGDAYKAMMVIIIKDGNGVENRYRYDLFSGKQIIITDEYSTIAAKDLRKIETILATSYIGNTGSNKVHTFYEAFLYKIDLLNQNTPDWKPILDDPDYTNIPKFSNRRKPKAKTTE